MADMSSCWLVIINYMSGSTGAFLRGLKVSPRLTWAVRTTCPNIRCPKKDCWELKLHDLLPGLFLHPTDAFVLYMRLLIRIRLKP